MAKHETFNLYNAGSNPAGLKFLHNTRIKYVVVMVYILFFLVRDLLNSAFFIVFLLCQPYSLIIIKLILFYT